jgi:hypothetical protein
VLVVHMPVGVKLAFESLDSKKIWGAASLGL